VSASTRDPRCETCAFWRMHTHDPVRLIPRDEMDSGDCRAHAPKGHENYYRVWPQTDKHDWCGDWERRSQYHELMVREYIEAEGRLDPATGLPVHEP